MQNYIQPGEVITLAAPYDRSSGEGALVGSIFGVATKDVLSGASAEFRLVGVHTLAKTSAQAWTVGQKIYWDNANKRCDTDSTLGQLIGVATAVADNPSSTGTVRLNGGVPSTSEGPQAAIASLTDNGGGTADGTVAAQAEPVTLTDNTGLSGTHDDTLAAPSVPADIAGGDSPTEAEHNAALASMRILAQNQSDSAQKVIELVSLSATAQDNLKEVTTKVEAILVALRAAGIIAA